MKSHTRSLNVQVTFFRTIKAAKRAFHQFMVAFVCLSMLMPQSLLMAQNPTGGVVTGGAATINQGANLTTIQQSTNRAVIDWQGFSVGAGNTVNFNLPNSSSAILNRVTGGNPSAIYGALNSNGNVYLLNQNGILIGNGATLNVGGFTATTLDISNNQFMKGGELRFTGDSTASVINEGTIIANNGNVFMMGAHVENRGTITAPVGMVGLAAGQDVRLVDSKYPSMVVAPNSRSLGGTGVSNTGTINSAAATLAAANGNVYALAINNEGTVRATGAEITADGEVYLRANGGRIVTSGSIIARSGVSGQNGGKVEIDAGADGFANIQGNVDASGRQGGDVKVNAGRTLLQGEINASGQRNGGSVEIAGRSFDQSGLIDASGLNAAGGNVSVDVSGDYIATAAGDINVSGTRGGNVSLFAGNKLLSSGEINASGTRGAGGRIDLSGVGRTALLSAEINASGITQGGRIRVGGELKGGREGLDEFTNSLETIITSGSNIIARGTGANAQGGEVIVWSDGDTDFYGNIDVSGNGLNRGGFIELSAAETLIYDQAAGIVTGQGGTLLLDPKNGIITDTPPSGVDIAKIVLDKTVLEGVIPGDDPVLLDDDEFGFSVDFNDAGDLLAIGSRFDDAGGSNRGSAYIFSLDPLDPAAGILLETRISDGLNGKVQLENGDQFGSGVAFNGAGDVLAVGAPLNDLGGTAAGSVFLFSIDVTDIAGNTNLQQTVTDGTDTLTLTPGDQFGTSVDFNNTGDLLAVGAARDSTGGLASGAVYLFTLDPADLTQTAVVEQKIDSTTPGLTLQTDGRFGIGVALNGTGDVLAVGSHTNDTGGTDRGAVFLLSVDPLNPTTPVTLGQTIDSNTAGLTLADGDLFGISVSLNDAGDLLAAGASSDNTGGADRGAAYILTLDPTDLSQAVGVAQKIDDTTTGLTLNDRDNFGRSVAFNGAGDLLAVGSPGADSNPANDDDRGAVYLFSLDTFDPAAEAFLELKIDDGSDVFSTGTSDDVGQSVALNSAGDLLAVGAPDTGTPGTVYLFTLDPNNLNAPVTLANQITDGTDGISVGSTDQFGTGVALNDTGNLLAVGAGRDANGSVSIFTIDPVLPESQVIFEQKIENGTDGITPTANAEFGQSVAFNGTGSLLAVGAPNDDVTGAALDSGAVYLFTLDPNSPSTGAQFEQRLADGSLGLTLDNFDDFGFSVALNSAGSILAVGDPSYDAGGSPITDNFGAAYLFTVNPAAPATPAVFQQRLENGTAGLTIADDDDFGSGIALNDAGNILAVGARGTDSVIATLDAGSVYLFEINPVLPAAPANLVQQIVDDSDIDIFEFEQLDQFGAGVALNGAGDILVVGAPGDESTGSVYLFGFDPNDTSVAPELFQKTINQDFRVGENGDLFGDAVALNADGDLLAVGVSRRDLFNTGLGGEVYVFSLDPNTVSSSIVLEQQITEGTGGLSIEVVDQFGSAVAFNGPGNILAVGGREFSDEGTVWIFELDPDNLVLVPQLRQKLGEGTSGIVFDTGLTNFGEGVALNNTGDLLAVGAPREGNGGTAYIFSLDTTDLTVEAQLEQTIDDASLGFTFGSVDEFGVDLDFNADGSLLAVGAESTDARGAVYLFSLDPLNPSTPVVTEQIIQNGSNGLSLDIGGLFGAGVSLNGAGDQLLVGAPTSDFDGEVYRFTLDATTPSNPAVLNQVIGDGFSGITLNGFDGFGASVALNDAGTLTVIGTSRDDTLATDSGAVYVIRNLIPLGDPGDMFADVPDDTTFILPSQITNLLNAGTNVNLEFNNDLRVASDVIVTGANPGAWDIEVGRSFSVDNDVQILTNGGDFSVTLNDADAILASRDPGLATFTLGFDSIVATTDDTFTGIGGDLTIDINDLDGTRAGIVQLSSGSVLFSGSGDLTITAGNGGSGLPAVSMSDASLGTFGPGNLTITSLGGDITTRGGFGFFSQIFAGGTATFETPATDDIILEGFFNDFVGPVNVPMANNVIIEDNDAFFGFFGPPGLQLGTINANSLSVFTAGPLTDVGAANITGDATFFGSTIDLNQLNVQGNITLDSFGNSSIVNAVDVTLLDSNVGGDLSVTATTGDITDLGVITVDGMADFNTPGNISLNQLAITGSIGFNAGGNVLLVNSLDTDLKNSTAGGELEVSAGVNDLTDSGSINVLGPFAGFTGNNITLDQLNIINGELGLSSFGNSTVVNAGTINFTSRAFGSTVGGDLVARAIAGDIVDAGPLFVSGMADFISANTILLDQISITGSIGLTSPGDSTIVNAVAVDLKTSTVTGDLDVTATTGDVTDSARVAVNGMAHFTGEDIVLDQLAVNGPIGLNATGNATVVNTTNVNLKDSNVAGDLDVTATTGIIFDTGVVNVGGMAHFTASSIFLDQLIAAGSVGVNSIGDATIVNDGDLDLKTSNVGGDLTATSLNGNVTDSGVVTVGGIGSFTGAEITLDQLNVAGGINLTSTGNATVVNDSTLLLLNANVGGMLSLTSTLGDVISGDVAAAGVEFIAGQDVVIRGNVAATNGVGVNLQASRDIIVDAVAAGQDVSVSAINSDVALQTTTGDIRINGSAANTARVGSQNGTTTITAADDFLLESRGADAVVGFAGASPATGNINVTANHVEIRSLGGTAQVGHQNLGGGPLAGDISVLSNNDIRLSGDGGARARIGHFNNGGPINSEIVVAVDFDATSTADNGGRFILDSQSTIGETGDVRLFAPRQDGNMFADGAFIGGLAVDSSLPPGTQTADRFNFNLEGLFTPREQYLVDFDPAAQPFAPPFTFFYEQRVLSPIVLDAIGASINDVYDRFRIPEIRRRPQPVINTITIEYTGPWFFLRVDEITGASSYDYFGQLP